MIGWDEVDEMTQGVDFGNKMMQIDESSDV